ncbi:hypothetical protein CC86DRAFT_393303 [Ophiobolus disseminans]|uniref:VWFA domain-containing protein n=1 Tax=Ophiobolus disseminans TaxID=1469910 RepID=A0A6A7A6E0_9PLEO|nr:hypothetical protein CC86DRAFT_393303 [Ophiobolus disseminans]
MFGSLKKKLSKRSSNPLNDPTWSGAGMSSNAPTNAKSTGPWSGGLTPPQDHNSVSSSSPATRRPNRSSMNPFSSSNDAPPAYTPGPAQIVPPVVSADSDDDPYTFLKSFDTIFIIDDSGSMAGSSWTETARALETITPICTARDADGIDIYFLNHPDSSHYKNITRDSVIKEIFQSVRPSGATPTGQRLHSILGPYLERYRKRPKTTKPINIIVITDGAATDDLDGPIMSAAKKLDRLDAPSWQVGIQFFQVGKDERARKALKALDDELGNIAGDGDLRDIVDTVPFTGEGNAELNAQGILKVVLGSVNRRIDRNSKELYRK